MEEAPSRRRRLPMETRRPCAADGPDVERGEVRSFAGLSLVLAPGVPAPGDGALSAAAPSYAEADLRCWRRPDGTANFLRDGRRLGAPC